MMLQLYAQVGWDGVKVGGLRGARAAAMRVMGRDFAASRLYLRCQTGEWWTRCNMLETDRSRGDLSGPGLML